MSRWEGGYVQGWVYLGVGTWDLRGVSTNPTFWKRDTTRYGRQAGSTYLTGMLSCWDMSMQFRAMPLNCSDGSRILGGRGMPTTEGHQSIITARKRSLGQGNIFAPVCHSVHRGGGSASVHARIPPSRTRQVPPPEVGIPGTKHPPPPEQSMLEDMAETNKRVRY